MIVYQLLNTVNNKSYIGQHQGENISDRWDNNFTGANTHLSSANDKYGSSVFRREILNNCSSHEEMNNLERLWILVLRTYDPEFGYNQTMGGEGYPNHNGTVWITDGKSNKRILPTDAIPDNWGLGKIIQVTEKFLKAAITNIAKAREAYRLKPNKKNPKLSNLIWITNGIENKRQPKGSPLPDKWRPGRIHTVEVKELLISSIARARTFQTPESYKQRGKKLQGQIWINDGNTNKKIPGNTAIPKGWSRGRANFVYPSTRKSRKKKKKD
jgi:hypothetical protein